MLILGCGYVGEHLARACIAAGITVSGTTRDQARADELRAQGIHVEVVQSPDQLSDQLLAAVDYIVDSIPLTRDEQRLHASQLSWLATIAPKLNRLKWAAYLSTTGVYGDVGGAWVDETFVCHPDSLRGQLRLQAERCWLESGLPAEVFRLAGIYGPGRNILGRLRAGGYKAVAWQPPHYSSRIHVDDIVNALLAAMEKPRAGRIVNVCDDEPLPHDDYVRAVAGMIGAEPPMILTPEQGAKELSAAMLSFFQDNKRVKNLLLHSELLPELKFPSFRQGIASLDANER